MARQTWRVSNDFRAGILPILVSILLKFSRFGIEIGVDNRDKIQDV